MKDDGERLTGAELDEAVAEAHDKLFSTPPPERGVTDEEVRRAHYRLFGEPVPPKKGGSQ